MILWFPWRLERQTRVKAPEDARDATPNRPGVRERPEAG
jgi:hypothetical protein